MVTARMRIALGGMLAAKRWLVFLVWIWLNTYWSSVEAINAAELTSNITNYEKYYMTLSQFGVQHVQLHGTIKSESKSQVIVALHVFMHGHNDEQGFRVHGMLFAEDVSEKYGLKFNHLTQPSGFVNTWVPPLRLHDLATGAVSKPSIVSNHVKKRHFVPYYFQEHYATSISCFQVEVEGWVRHGEVCFNLAEQRTFYSDAHEQKKLWYLLPPWRGQRPGDFARMIDHQLVYHLTMGFDGALIFLTQASLHLLLSSPSSFKIRDWASQGKLVLILWDYFSSYIYPSDKHRRYPKIDQAIIRSQALLRFSSLPNQWLFMIDFDEYLATSVPGLYAPDLIEKCLPKAPPKLASINFLRYHYRLPDKFGLQADGQPQAEFKIWQHKVWEDGCHPLQLYEAVEEKAIIHYQGKEIVIEPKAFYSYFVHEGDLKPGWQAITLNASCAHVIHVVNQWGGRLPMDTFTSKNNKWHWIFKTTLDRHGNSSFPCSMSDEELQEAVLQEE